MPSQPVDLKSIKNALLAKAVEVVFTSTINGFSTWAQPPSRRLKLFNNVDPSNQPACFLLQHRETYTVRKSVGNLSTRYLNMGFWCYAPTGDESVVGDDLLDLMISAFELVLAPDDPTVNELTLGQQVHWCRIVRDDGMFIRDPGDIDGQALLVLPVRILLP
jgi:hypothetical protein